jgi:hypothetical protein
LKETTWDQYAATSGSYNYSAKYINARTSFSKQDPPNPIEACKYLEPILESEPMHRDNSFIDPLSNFSVIKDIEFIEDTR